MATTQSDSVPKTANLLACKQWWKVCFLHGDQEKYYRQIYGRAAAQRLANFPKDEDKNKSSVDSKIIFPTKLHSPVVIENGTRDTFKLTDYQNRRNKSFRDDPIVPGKSIINILDDPFLFGINEVNENGSDSGIDANCPTKQSNKNNRDNLDSNSNYGFSRVDDIKASASLLPPPRPPKSTHQSSLHNAANKTWVDNWASIKQGSSDAML